MTTSHSTRCQCTRRTSETTLPRSFSLAHTLPLLAIVALKKLLEHEAIVSGATACVDS